MYHGQNHFTSRIIDSDGTIWYNDGMESGGQSIEDSHLSTITDGNLRKYNGKNLVLAIYA